MTDRELLKQIWKDLLKPISFGGFTGLYLVATADKIRAHICNSEGCGWDSEIITAFLKEDNSETAKILNKQIKSQGFHNKSYNLGTHPPV